jgi:hypothetical protein
MGKNNLAWLDFYIDFSGADVDRGGLEYSSFYFF